MKDYKTEIEKLRNEYRNLLEQYSQVALEEEKEKLKEKYDIEVGSDVMYTHPYGKKNVTDRCKVCLNFNGPVNMYSRPYIMMYPYKKDGQLSTKYYRVEYYEFNEGKIQKVME